MTPHVSCKATFHTVNKLNWVIGAVSEITRRQEWEYFSDTTTPRACLVLKPLHRRTHKYSILQDNYNRPKSDNFHFQENSATTPKTALPS